MSGQWPRHIKDPSWRDEAFGLIPSLVESVVLHPIERGFEIELVGEIANMVALAADQSGKNSKAAAGAAAFGEVYRCSAKVVAGAGFEPATFRL